MFLLNFVVAKLFYFVATLNSFSPVFFLVTKFEFFSAREEERERERENVLLFSCLPWHPVSLALPAGNGGKYQLIKLLSFNVIAMVDGVAVVAAVVIVMPAEPQQYTSICKGFRHRVQRMLVC